jgi:hypothetical protein
MRVITTAFRNRNRRGLKTACSPRFFDELLAFPEMKDVISFEHKGQFNQAVESIKRIRDIATATLGQNSDMSNAAALKLMQLHRLNGDTANAVALGRSAPYYDKKEGVTNAKFKLQILTELSRVFINNCDMTSSLSCAESAIKLLESQDDKSVDISLFSTAYGLKGLSSLFLGKYEEAEDYLQFASRWSNTVSEDLDPVEADIETKSRQLIALSNLSFFHWLSQGPGIHFDYFKENRYQLDTTARAKWASESLSPPGKWQDFEKVASEAGMYLEEGISLALQSDVSQLEDKLKNAVFCSVYATALCNSAQVSLFLGKAEVADEKLASAIKALEVTKASAVTSDKEYKYRVHCQPVLGRALSMVARQAMEANSAVTAEGLFRSSIDMFGEPFTKGDCRHGYHQALAIHHYGYLQTKWERREDVGRKVLSGYFFLLPFFICCVFVFYVCRLLKKPMRCYSHFLSVWSWREMTIPMLRKKVTQWGIGLCQRRLLGTNSSNEIAPTKLTRMPLTLG